jgi:ubiquinone/menaquinone biosynthesis C-methylase UbiE
MAGLDLKDDVRRFWDSAPCGTSDATTAAREPDYARLERQRAEREPFISDFARFDETRGKRVLEVGVGAGTDHIRFARAGARCVGIDLSDVSLLVTRNRFEREGFPIRLSHGDAEALPFADGSFALVYSWGVIHHTPDTQAAAREILRVLQSGGRFCVMVYNRHSLLALQAWLVFAAARGSPFTSVADVIRTHVESPGTRAFTAREAQQLFRTASQVSVETLVTPYDLRIGRRLFLPAWARRLVPARFGWFHVVTGIK